MREPLILPSPEIWHRDDYPLLCNWRKLYRCAEIGVDRAEFASLFLERFPQCEQFWAIDGYEPYGEMQFSREADFLTAVARLERHARRAKLLRHRSLDAAQFFPDEALDFVYVDGDHTYPSVAADLEAWFPKIAPGGILAGHDWTDYPVHAGVKKAVKEFAFAKGLTVYLTAVEGYNRELCPSWYTYKNGMPGPGWRRC